jgi:hypothetical protein
MVISAQLEADSLLTGLMIKGETLVLIAIISNTILQLLNPFVLCLHRQSRYLYIFIA